MTSSISTITGFNGQELKVVDANFDNAKMEQDDFLKILLADIKYQNPLEAKDISEFINNSVKLREMEVLNSFESSIKALTSNNSAAALLQASNLIDKKIKYEGNRTYVENGKSEVEFKLNENAEIVNLYIYDKNGNIVDSQTFTNLNGGITYPFEIDNENIPDGYYSVSIEAKRGDAKVDSTIYSTAIVTGIEKDNEKIYAIYEDGKIDMENIIRIGG